MNHKYTRISQLENFFSKFLTAAKVSQNIFVGEDLPATISKDWETMVLADVNPQYDWNSHTQGSVSIFLYATPTGAKLTKNVRALNSMEETLDTALEASSDEHYSLNGVNWRDHGYDSIRNLHFQIINVEVVVK